MTRYTGVLVAALALGAAMPAAAQNREHQQIAAETRMMQEQLQQLAISLTTLSQSMNKAVEELASRIDQVNQAMVKGFADQGLRSDNLSNDVRVVRERTDDNNVRIGTLRDELEALRMTVLALQQQLAAAGQQTALPADPNAPAPDPSAAPVAPPPVVMPPAPSVAGLSPQRMFSEAQSDYFAANYGAAIAGFEAFLRAFPRVELSDDAQFLIGESHFNQNRWPEAIAAYNQVIQNYPGTNSVPDAYYKRGLAQDRAGDVESARASWEAVIRFAPDSTAAVLAKQNLDRTGPAAQR